MGKAAGWMICALLLASCGGDTAATRNGATATGLPDGPWRELAQRLVTAESLEASVAATREILAHGGVATHDGERVLVAARGPAASFTVSPRESVHLAMEARRRTQAGRLDIAELAQLLENFGWPFPDADPGRQAVDARDRLGLEDGADETGADDDAALEAQRDAARQVEEALRERLQDTTRRWQLARQAVNKAPPAERPRAQQEVDRLWAERNALIARRGEAQRQAGAERDALRERLIEAREQQLRQARAQRLVGADPVQGERLMALLDTWVAEAARRPEDPRSFTPLFLAEMARLQDAPVDLPGSRSDRPGRGEGPPVDLRGAPRSQQLRWTLLELELFGAAFDRERSAQAPAVAMPIRRAAGSLADVLLPPALAGTPCVDYKSAYGDAWGEVAAAGGGWGVGEALERGIGAAVDTGTAEGFGNAMNAIGIATKLAKLASFYADNQVYVEPEPHALHKPTGNHEMAMFTARVGLDEAAVKEYERQLREVSAADRAARDCLQSLGFPTASDLSDMTREAEDWLIEWELFDGRGNHAMEAAAPTNVWFLPGRRAMKLARESATSLRSDYYVLVLPEAAHSGTVVRAYATAEARVDGAGMPSLGTIVTGAAGGLGLAEALVDLFGGWLQYMNMPKAYATIEIEYHCPRPGTLHSGSGPGVADGGGDDGPNECLIAAGRG